MRSISSELTLKDKLGSALARLTFNRMQYAVEPGLYALGKPDETSPVFVSANYKMSFDYLRSSLDGVSGWILVLDTNGINVWCAAGKGTFGTDEIVKRIKKTDLKKHVKHREIIVPQLGAPGVAAHEVKKRSGFSVVYGPVRADDIKQFLHKGKKTTKEMRTVNFTAKDRAVLLPAEFVLGFKYIFAALVVVILMSKYINVFDWILAIVTGFLSGSVITPLLLPWIPGKSFSSKGAAVGIVAAIFLNYANVLIDPGWVFIIGAISSYYAMNFTGASTFTSLSGVKKEMMAAVPAQALSLVFGIILVIT